MTDIPKGSYCYEIISVNEKTGQLKIKPCKYWSIRKDLSYQSNGYCGLLNKSDEDFYNDEGYISHLWDMLKECGENWDED